MACSCIAKDYDANVYSTDCKTLVYEDRSVWMQDKGFDGLPEELDLTITTPGGKQVVLTINPSKSNVITSVDLFGDASPRCLPDGLYCFELVSCGLPYKITKPYLCNTQCKIDTVFARINGQADRNHAEELQRLVDGLHSATETGQTKLAEDLLTLLNRHLNNERCSNC